MISIQPLRDLFKHEESEQFLMARVLAYAKRGDFTKYTSTRKEDWRVSIMGLTQSLFLCFDAHGDSIPELHAEEDYTKDPAAAFGIKEAQLHRQRGITLGLFLALTKYYRQSYIDLVIEQGFSIEEKRYFILYITRFFDRVEIGFATEWSSIQADQHVAELEAKNREITNEKNKYRTIFESINIPIVFLSENGQIMDLNQKAIESFIEIEEGFQITKNPEGVLIHQKINDIKSSGKPLSDLTEERLGLETEFYNFMAQFQGNQKIERTISTINGVKHYEIIFQKMLDFSAKFAGAVVFFYDLTLIRTNERELESAKREIEAILAALPQGILVISQNGELLVKNEMASNHFLQISQLELGKVNNILNLNPTTEFLKILRKLAENFEETSLVVETIKERQWINIKSKIIRLDNRREEILILEFHDVSEYIEFDNLRKQFVSTVSHELRTPITSIKLSIKNLMKYRDKISEEKKDALFEMIASGTDILSRMIEDLLVLSRVDSQKINLKREMVNLTQLIEQVEFQLNPVRQDKNITIEKTLLEQVLFWGDEVRLTQIFRIMLDNAIKYSHPNSSVEISVETLKNELLKVSFRDYGIGIHEKDIENLFARFFRSQKVQNIPGTGLGLSIAKTLVELHAGWIEVNSELGKGTTFEIFLPLLDPNTQK